VYACLFVDTISLPMDCSVNTPLEYTSTDTHYCTHNDTSITVLYYPPALLSSPSSAVSPACSFPPDETTLLGAAQGFSQAGLVPIIEIPYAKYLDCGADMFYEIGITYWLTNGKQKKGMVIRVQGFDRGKFGGNFHTHNIIHSPPGVDVVCFSNGSDYVRGMRYAVRQAVGGRVVVFMDSTDLLNRRHLGLESDASGRKDSAWLTEYPCTDCTEMTFDDIVMYSSEWLLPEKGPKVLTPFSPIPPLQRTTPDTPNDSDANEDSVLIVTYGNGVPNALQAMERIVNTATVSPTNIHVIDTPYLSSVPAALKLVLQQQQRQGQTSRGVTHVVFADVCKEGPGMIYGGYVTQLQKDGCLPSSWMVVGAQATYNPLGQTLTFLSSDDIEACVRRLIRGKEKVE
jgi:hypothetical protein